MTPARDTAPRNSPLHVALYGLCVGLLCAGSYSAEYFAIGSQTFDFPNLHFSSAIVVYGGAGVVAGTIGGMFAVLWPQHGRQPIGVGITGFLIVLPVSVAVFLLVEAGHVDAQALCTVGGLSALVGLFPWRAEMARQRARNGRINPSDAELYTPPPKPSAEASEFDLSE